MIFKLVFLSFQNNQRLMFAIVGVQLYKDSFGYCNNHTTFISKLDVREKIINFMQV